MNSPNTNFTENDQTVGATLPVGGIGGVELVTKRGPIGDVKTIITSWEQFRRLYGGFINNATDPAVLLAKRALDGGSALRVSRLVHYTDPSDPTSHTAEFSAPVASNIFTFASAPAAGHTVSYTSGSAVDQLFDTSALVTLQLLAAKIKAAFSTVDDVLVISTTQIVVVPSGAAIVGDVVAVTGAGAPAVVRTTSSTFKNSAGDDIFSLAPKYPGQDYDNLKFVVAAGSNGQAGYWDLQIIFRGETNLNETYRNILIPGSPTANASLYLSEVVKKSKLVSVTYNDLSAIVTNPIVPVPFAISLFGGDDGDALVAADYIGDSAGKTGLYIFDGTDDVAQIAILNGAVPAGVHAAGFAYAEARKDLQYFGYVSGETEAEVIAAKDALLLDSSYGMLFSGDIYVLDPQTDLQLQIPSLGDILGLAAYSEKNFGLWYSFSGYNRGLIQSSLGAANQWGSPGNKANLDALANRQINVVINRSKRTMLWGSFTGQLATSQLSLANVRRFHIYLKKVLGPVLEQFIEEPCDITMFKQAFLVGKRIMDPLIPARAIFDYRWEGDQFADEPSQFKVNDPDDVSLGKYKVKLFVKDIASLQEFAIEVTLTPAGVSFDDALTLVQPS